MMSESAARTAVLTKHNRTMFLLNTKRSIEVIQCSGDEMTVILNNGLSDTIVSPSPFIPGPSAGLATALGAYWVPAGPAAATAPVIVSRGGAGGLQTIKTTGKLRDAGGPRRGQEFKLQGEGPIRVSFYLVRVFATFRLWGWFRSGGGMCLCCPL